jgi:ribonuclease P protein component
VVHVADRTGNAAAPNLVDSTVRAGSIAPRRAGFIVPKVVGGAVVRNRVRRQLRHLMRDRLSALPAGTDVVVRVLPTAVGRSYAQLGSDLSDALAAARSGRTTRPAGAGKGAT